MPPPTSHRRLVRPPGLQGVEILRGEMSRGSEAGGVFTHFTISAVEGAVSCYRRGSRREYSGRRVFFFNEGDFVPTNAHSDVAFRACCVAPGTMNAAANEWGHPAAMPRFTRFVSSDTAFYRLVAKTAAILAAPAEPLAHEEALAGLLNIVIGEHLAEARLSDDARMHRAVHCMRDLIHDGFNHTLSLDMLAAHARLNKFHALRLFKRAFGVPPHEYQRRLRVAYAAKMLRAGHGIAEVACAAGFCDQSHLSRALRQVTFITPGQYRALR